jgi:hypothetical protein
VHPMLRLQRPMIITQPINRLATDMISCVQLNFRGMPVDGLGRTGKTWALNCLALSHGWCPYPVAFFFLDYGAPERGTENYFSASMFMAAEQRIIRSATGAEGMARAGNLLLEKTKYLKEELIVFVINEANRFTTDELEHLVTLDNQVERSGKRLFCILNTQSDAKDIGTESINKKYTSQKKGRFFSANHSFTGLLWGPSEVATPDLFGCDVTMAIRDYEEGYFVPLSDAAPCLAYFAPNAYANGYRISAQMPLIRKCVENRRMKYGLPTEAPWPMQTFERFMYVLLVHIAAKDPNFCEFDVDQIDHALIVSGLVELELSYHPV